MDATIYLKVEFKQAECLFLELSYSKNQYIIKTNSVNYMGLRFSDFMPVNHIPRKSIDLYTSKVDLKNNLENVIFLH